MEKKMTNFLPNLLFILLFGITAALSSVVLFLMYPNLNGLGSILLSTICSTPLAFYLFFNTKFRNRMKTYQRYILSALIFPVISGLVIMWSLYQQRPENIFKVFVADPVPAGISNIKAYDISAGIDMEILVAFDATPEAIEQIIKEHELKINENLYRSDIPFEYFPEINSEQDWTLYRKAELENINWWSLWVNTDKTTAIFQFIDG